MSHSADPIQEFFSIGEVCDLTGLKAHVLRYWENRSGNRVYQRKEIELILLVKHLLYTEKYTIDGARQKLNDHRKAGELRRVSREALGVETLAAMEEELRGLLRLLESPSEER